MAKRIADITLPTLVGNALKLVHQRHNLLGFVKKMFEVRDYKGIALFLTCGTEMPLYGEYISEISTELYNDVCLKYVSKGVFESDAELYGLAQELLRRIAIYAPVEEMVLKVLKLIEVSKSEVVITSALRALEVLLLRPCELRSLTLDWSLSCILEIRNKFPLPDYLQQAYDKEQEAVLEEEDESYKFLIFNITVGFFYRSIIEDICTEPAMDEEAGAVAIRSSVINRRNIMCYFLLEMLGKPLAFFDLTKVKGKYSNSCSMQCATSLTQGITKCVEDPYYFLKLVEFKIKKKFNLYEPKDIRKSHFYLMDDKIKLLDIAIYYYMVIVEGIGAEHIPLVYNPLYANEVCMYLIDELLSAMQPALHDKALKLSLKLLSALGKTFQIPSPALESDIHKSFTKSLCNLVANSPLMHLRQQGVTLLRQYIQSFDDEGKYKILRHLMSTVAHQGICGYLIIIYKDLVADSLAHSEAQLPIAYSGIDFRNIVLQNICKLQKGVETNLIDNVDQIISSLNAIRFLAIKDIKNRTGFWSLFNEVKAQYIEPLTKALNRTEAQYKDALLSMQECRSIGLLQKLNTAFGYDTKANTGLDLLDRDKIINDLNKNLCTCELIRSIVARVNEIPEQQPQTVQDDETVSMNN